MPEITDRDGLVAWLRTHGPDDSATIAARAALRTIPSMARFLSKNTNETDIILRVFRANAFAAWAHRSVVGGPELWVAAARAAVAAADAAFAMAFAVRPTIADDPALAAVHAVDAAAHALAACFAGDPDAKGRSSFFKENPVEHAITAAERAIDALREEGRAAADPGAHDAAFGSIIADISAIWQVRRDPLWLVSTPLCVRRDWEDLKGQLLRWKQNWEVWTDWYDALLEGRRLDPSLELKKSLIPDDVWNQGPAAVNAEIARLIAEHRPNRAGAGSTRAPPRRPPPLGPEPGPHDYDPATAGLAELKVILVGDLRDERAEAELSRFATLLRRRLLDVTAWRDVPLVLGNNMQVDYLGLHRVGVARGSVESNWLVTLTVVSALWAMTADYKDVKEGLAEIRADVEAAVASAVEAFTNTLPDDPPLTEPRCDLLFRDDGDVLADLLDKERQARLRGLSGDEPAH